MKNIYLFIFCLLIIILIINNKKQKNKKNKKNKKSFREGGDAEDTSESTDTPASTDSSEDQPEVGTRDYYLARMTDEEIRICEVITGGMTLGDCCSSCWCICIVIWFGYLAATGNMDHAAKAPVCMMP